MKNCFFLVLLFCIFKNFSSDSYEAALSNAGALRTQDEVSRQERLGRIEFSSSLAKQQIEESERRRQAELISQEKERQEEKSRELSYATSSHSVFFECLYRIFCCPR